MPIFVVEVSTDPKSLQISTMESSYAMGVPGRGVQKGVYYPYVCVLLVRKMYFPPFFNSTHLVKSPKDGRFGPKFSNPRADPTREGALSPIGPCGRGLGAHLLGDFTVGCKYHVSTTIW